MLKISENGETIEISSHLKPQEIFERVADIIASHGNGFEYTQQDLFRFVAEVVAEGHREFLFQSKFTGNPN